MKVRSVHAWRCALGVTLASLYACSSPSDGAPPDASTPDAAFTQDAAADAAADDATSNASLDANSDDAPSGASYPAPHADFPRVESLGGPVLSMPNVVPIFFANDPLQAQIEQFLAQLTGSSYWTETTSEYGVTGLQVAPSIVVSDSVPSSITGPQISSWLAGYLDGTHPEWPAINNQNVYVVFYPEGTTVTQADGSTSCIDFGGYHNEGIEPLAPSAAGDAGIEEDAEASDDAASGASGARGPSFVYAVLPRCATFNTLAGLDSLTAAVSHELVEAATNPFTRTRRAFQYVDFDHVAWAIGLTNDLFVGEVSDMCHSESPDRAYQRLVGNFMVQRSWSNLAAAANRDPCVPAVPGVYIGAAPEFNEVDVILNDGGFPNALLTSGARIAVGQSTTLTVRLFSTGPTADWYVTPFQRLAAVGAAPTLRMVLDKGRGNNGDILKLTITRVANGPTFGGTEIFLVSSAMPLVGQGPRPASNAWYGFVEN